MFDTLQKPVYTLEQASQIAEEAAARALKNFVAQFAPGIGSALHLENRIPPQNVHPSELPKIMGDQTGKRVRRPCSEYRTHGCTAYRLPGILQGC